MSVQSQINRIKSNLAAAYTAAQSKGATIPSQQNSANLAAAISSITGGGAVPEQISFDMIWMSPAGDIQDSLGPFTVDKKTTWEEWVGNGRAVPAPEDAGLVLYIKSAPSLAYMGENYVSAKGDLSSVGSYSIRDREDQHVPHKNEVIKPITYFIDFDG